MASHVPEAVGTTTLPMLLAKLGNRGETMEGLHDIQHVAGAHACRLAFVVVIQVLVRELLILDVEALSLPRCP